MFHIVYVFGSSTELKKISVKDVINVLALESSLAKIERLNFENKILQYDNFKKSFLPSMSFNFNPISFNHSLRLLQQPSNGSYDYVNDYSNNSNAGVTISQKIGLTGGIFTMGSSINYLYEFLYKRNSFNSTPYIIGYSQQLWGGGKTTRLDVEIENLKHEQDIKQYCTNISDIQQQALKLFMSLFLTQMEMDLAQKNRDVNDTLMNLAHLKQQNGSFTTYDYNQVEIQAANSKYVYENALNNHQLSASELFTFLGINENINILTVEAPVFDLPLSLDTAILKVYVDKNNPYWLSEKIKKMEAEKSLFASKMSNKLNGNLNFSFGANQYASVLPEAYQNLQPSQSISIELKFPVFQWGTTRNKLRIAENTYKVSLIEMEKERREFYNNIAEQVNTYNNNVKLWLIAEKTFVLSKDQYKLSLQKFLFGKISLYELYTAQQEQSSSLQKYYNAVCDAWTSYFILRKTALYDFTSGLELENIFVKVNKHK
jgi:outer membrane protein